jgi:cell division protein FtsW
VARRLKSDRVLFMTALLLVCASVVMVYSASAVIAADHFVTRQSLWAALGLALLAIAMHVDYRTYRSDTFIWIVIAVVVMLLVAVLFARPINDARRWLDIGGLGIQPSELAKLVSVLFAALILERRMHRINEVGYSLLPIGIVVGGLAALILKQLQTFAPCLEFMCCPRSFVINMIYSGFLKGFMNGSTCSCTFF